MTIADQFSTAEAVVGIATDMLTVVALFAGAWWFLVRRERLPRTSFDIECEFSSAGLPEGMVAAEVRFRFINAGHVEHLAYNLTLSIHTIDPDNLSQRLTGELGFHRSLLPLRYLLGRGEPYYVRPGVSQAITHIVLLDRPSSLIRITAAFTHDSDGQHVHTARRLFCLPIASGSAYG